MKIRLLSDLHIEVSPYNIDYNNEDILVLAGDISTDPYDIINLVNNYLKQNKNTQIIFVLGNHDYYDRKIHQTFQIFESVNIPRFHFLQDSSTVINGIRFFGSTLWTDLKGVSEIQVENSILDYHRIPQFTPKTCKFIHNCSLNSLKHCLKNSSEPVVVISHHLPSYKSIHEKYKNNPLSPVWASNLDDLVKQTILWMHGHTHSSLDYKIDSTRVVCNPRGYCRYNRKENPEFDNYFTIELNTK